MSKTWMRLLAAAAIFGVSLGAVASDGLFVAGAQFGSFKSVGVDKPAELRLGPVTADESFAAHANEAQVTWSAHQNRIKVEYLPEQDLLRATVENAKGTFRADYPALSAEIAQRFGDDVTIADVDQVRIVVRNQDRNGSVRLEQLTVEDQIIAFNGREAVLDHCVSHGLSFSGLVELIGNFSNDYRKAHVTVLLGVSGKEDQCSRNRVPTARIVARGRPTVGATITLDGTESVDEDGDALTYRWSLQTKPPTSQASIDFPHNSTAQLVLDRPGDYVAQLIVDDGEDESHPAERLISTENSPPVANAGPDQLVPLGSVVRLDASLSSDIDDDAISYRWALTGRPSESLASLDAPNSASPSFIADRPGNYVAELVVSDGELESGADTVAVSTANSIPRAMVVAPSSPQPVGAIVTLDGTRSSDPDGDMLSFEWFMLARPSQSAASITSAGSTASFLADAEGDFEVGLIVSDGRASSTMTAVRIVAERPNQDPQIQSLAETETKVGEHYVYRVDVSDPDGDPLSFALSVAPAGMTISNEGLISWEPTQPGEFPVAVVVTDGRGGAARQTFTVVVADALFAAEVIGPEGGDLVLADGLRLHVPAGALHTATTISVREIESPTDARLPPGTTLAGKLYHFEPEGLVFDSPVELTVPYDPALLPLGYAEGDVFVYRKGQAPQLHIVVDASRDEDEAHWQEQLPEQNLVRVHIRGFSSYGAVGNAQASTWVANRHTANSASVVIRRPPGGMRDERPQSQTDCTQVPLAVRAQADTEGVVIHTTNGGNPAGTLNGALGWATDECVRYFAHYMIDKNGEIYQVSDDDAVLAHAASTSPSGLTNANSIGIEVLNNVGEPYDGRQIAALVRLLDYLFERYGWARPARDPATGLYVQNRTAIATGGERVITHFDINGKCDPIGSMRSSESYIALDQALGWTQCNTAGVVAIPDGDPNAPPLIDAIYDALAMLGRDRSHTGVINTSGGDAMGLANPGNGGSVTFRHNPGDVATIVGGGVPVNYGENLPLIVGPGSVRTLNGTQAFTDVIIAGRLEVDGSLELRLIGTFYLAPNGRIVIRNGSDGGQLRVFSRGMPIVQGLIDASGADASAADTAGGNGGDVEFVWSGDGSLLVPALITRGGDADLAAGAIGSGGEGGAVSVSLDDGIVFVGGGVGPMQTPGDLSTAHPPIRDVLLDVSLPEPPTYVGDSLPPPPPFNRYSSIAAPPPGIGVRVPLRTAYSQTGFSRGVLTSGGTGGLGRGDSAENLNGGAGGDGGAIQISVGPLGAISFRDADLITGADVEMATKQLMLPEGGLNKYGYFFVSGSLGGSGQWQDGFTNPSGGSGGPGGRAGDIRLTGTLDPAPATFVPVGSFPDGAILGIDRPFESVRPMISDDFIWDFIFGRRVQATASDGTVLYRVRLDLNADEALGGSGGLPVGGIKGEFPGWFGTKGANGLISGLPLQ